MMYTDQLQSAHAIYFLLFFHLYTIFGLYISTVIKVFLSTFRGKTKKSQSMAFPFNLLKSY